MSSRVTSALGPRAPALIVAACGGGESSSSGPVTLNWWAGNQPGGSFQKAAEYCSKQSNGEYTIKVNLLGTDADSQRQSLVRRLAAGDSSIDLIAMDVVWTAEFAEADWILPFPADKVAELKKDRLEGPLKTAQYDGKLYAAPGNSNTQLLWYRKSQLKGEPVPKTWDQLIDTAKKLGTTIAYTNAYFYIPFTIVIACDRRVLRVRRAGSRAGFGVRATGRLRRWLCVGRRGVLRVLRVRGRLRRGGCRG